MTSYVYFNKNKYIPLIGEKMWDIISPDFEQELKYYNREKIDDLLYNDKTCPFHKQFQQEDLTYDFDDDNEFLTIDYSYNIDDLSDIDVDEAKIKKFISWLESKVIGEFNCYFGDWVFKVRGNAKYDEKMDYYDYENYLNGNFEESKKSARKSIKESLNFKKDYAVSVSGTNWLKPFYWDFDEFRDDLLIASEEEEFTYYITEATATDYRINVEFNDSFDRRYDITFRIIPKSDKATAKELNDYLS